MGTVHPFSRLVACLAQSLVKCVYVWSTCVYELEPRKFVIFACVSNVRDPLLTRWRRRSCRRLTGSFFVLFRFWDRTCLHLAALIRRIADVDASFLLYPMPVPHFSCVYDIVIHQEIDIVILLFFSNSYPPKYDKVSHGVLIKLTMCWWYSYPANDIGTLISQ